MRTWISRLRNPAPPAAPVVDDPARVKFKHRDRKVSESSMGTEGERQRITFVGQKQDSVLRVGEVSSSARGDLDRAEVVPELSYDLGAPGAVTATMNGRVCRALVEHCGESNLHGREVGGVLVGYRSEGEFTSNSSKGRDYDLVVTNAIPIRSFDSSSDHLSFTEEVWARAEEEIRKKYAAAGKLRLGWYHTHPDQGIFFSDTDQTAHGIFAEPYQFALVIDPRGMDAGLFHWAWDADKRMAGPILFSLAGLRK